MRDNWLHDGQISCPGGVSSATDPDEIDLTQIAWAKNCSLRGGKPQTRPQLIERMVLPAGIVQGAGCYSFHGGMLILGIGGRLFRVQAYGNEFAYDELLDPTSGPNSAFLPQCWMQETDGSFVVQDGQSDAIIYDGNIPRRSIRQWNEVPLGRQMAYANGRLWVAVRGNELVAGDIKTAAWQSELKFTETGYLLGGGAFYFPRNISALAFLPRNDTTTGYGDLTVMGNDYAKAVRSNVPRDLWATTDGMVPDILVEVGAASHGAVVPVNQDLYFRDGEGAIRSLRGSRVDQQSPGNAPLSREVCRIVDHESARRLDTSTGIYFDNRLLMTASPFINSYNNTSFKHLISLDFATLSSMRGKAPPAYDGQWDGLAFQRLVKGKLNGRTRAFAITTSDGGENRLWEIMPGVREDASVFSGVLTPSPIKASVEYRRFGFNAKGQRKRLEACDLYMSKIDGEATVSVYWRADGSQLWRKWDEFTVCATTTDAEGAEPHVFKNLVAQHRAQVRTLTMPDEVNDITKYAAQIGFDFQLKLVWTGALQIDRVVLHANPNVEQKPFADREEVADECVMEDVTDDETDYAIPQAS